VRARIMAPYASVWTVRAGPGGPGSVGAAGGGGGVVAARVSPLSFFCARSAARCATAHAAPWDY
jgi:hypothetical protein